MSPELGLQMDDISNSYYGFDGLSRHMEESSGYFRSSLKTTGLNPSVQHPTATPGSSYHSLKLPFDLSVKTAEKIASQA
jgi:hypothetical protein